MAENLCLYYNNRFAWASSYGAVDRYANGTYTISNDTVYLNSHRGPSFIIQAASNKLVPKGKIQLVFKAPGQHAGYINATVGSQSLPWIDRLRKSGADYVVAVAAPARHSIRLEHTMFDTEPMEYPLPANSNQYTILVSDSIGQTEFNQLPLVWQGNDLKPLGDGPSTVFRFTGQYPSYEDVPWGRGEKPSTAVFDAWSQEQNAAFKKMALLEEAERKKEAQVAAEKMKQFLVNNRNDAYAIAQQYNSGVVVLLGEDSVDIDPYNTDTTVNNNRKELLAATYYRFFEGADKIPAFFQDKSPDAGKLMNVSVLPAQIILNPNGRPLFKNEGSVMDAAALHSLWEQLLTQEETRINDSLVHHFLQGAKDSASLFKQIETMARSGPGLKQALDNAGLSRRSLVDTAVTRYCASRPFDARTYDFIALAYLPDESWSSYTSSEDLHIATPTFQYLVSHFAERQRAAVADKRTNDSLLSRVYFGLTNALTYNRRPGGVPGPQPDSALAYLKRMITGVKRYTDFFTAIACLQTEMELERYKGLTLDQRRETIPRFMRAYFGAAIPNGAAVDSAVLVVYHDMRRDDNKAMIRTYIATDSSEGRFRQIGHSAAGYFLTQQARVLLEDLADSTISLAALQKSGALPLLEQAAAYHAVSESYLLRRNQAYALYLMGKNEQAISMLQEVLADMKLPANKYLATETRIKQVSDNLRAMKARQRIHWTVDGLVDY